MTEEEVIKEIKDIHDNAAALIVAAAAKSGLLKEVAEAMCFRDKYPNPSGDCSTCGLLERLAEAFDDHCCLAWSVLETFYGEDVPDPNGMCTEAELAPYLNMNYRHATDSHITEEK